MIDPTMWIHRGRLAIKALKDRAIDDGARIDDIEAIVRAAPCPFGPTPTGDIAAVWAHVLDRKFRSKKHRRRRPEQ